MTLYGLKGFGPASGDFFSIPAEAGVLRASLCGGRIFCGCVYRRHTERLYAHRLGPGDNASAVLCPPVGTAGL
jgi:hypothetical protein